VANGAYIVPGFASSPFGATNHVAAETVKAESRKIEPVNRKFRDTLVMEPIAASFCRFIFTLWQGYTGLTEASAGAYAIEYRQYRHGLLTIAAFPREIR
jgi:hypothetical protein